MSTVGALYRISGVNDPGRVVDVDPVGAATGFVFLLNTNAFGLKDLLLKYPDITNGSFKKLCTDNGLDFRIVQNVLYGK